MHVEPSYMCQPLRFARAPSMPRYHPPFRGPMQITTDTGYLLPMLTATPALGQQRPA